MDRCQCIYQKERYTTYSGIEGACGVTKIGMLYNRGMKNFREDNLFRKLVRFPMFLRHLEPSLRERMNRADWFESSRAGKAHYPGVYCTLLEIIL